MKIVKPANLRIWEKIGEPTLIGKKFGLEIWLQDYRNPKTGLNDGYSIFKKKEGIAVCTLTAEGSLVLTRQFKHAAGTFFYEFPAGNVENGNLSKTAKEEITQETGYVADCVLLLGESYIMPRKSPCREFAAIALGCRFAGEQDLDEGEDAIEVLEITIS